MSPVFDCTTPEGRAEAVAKAAAGIRRGALVVLPTDTVYGVGADAFSHEAVAALLEVKGRGREMPPPVLVARSATVDGLARDVPAYARDLIERFWPGPLTLVLKAHDSLAWDLGDTGGTVALRMPDDEVALALLAEVGPMAVSSANRTGYPASRTVLDAATQLGSGVEFYLDGGPAPGGLASTIVDCTRDEPVILREGALSAADLAEVLDRHRARDQAGTEPGETLELTDTETVPEESTAVSDTFYGSDFDALSRFDPEIAGALILELDRVRSGLQLIASENLSSPEVLTALGSTLSNKYAEGYPGRRYYGGCAEVDKVEELAIERCLAMLDADHANVQPHSGASANQAVYGAFMKPGETLLAMSLPHGGHLTHGSKVSFSGKWFNAVHYGVDRATEDIDYDQVAALAREHHPKVILAGGSAIPRLIDFAFFRRLADEVGAIFWVDAAHFIGLVAGKAIPSPVPHADVVSFTTHKVLRGPRSGAIVCKAEYAKAIDKAVFPMMQGGPQMHSIAAKAVNFKECSTPAYQEYAHQVIANARVLAGALGERGIRPTTGGTDTHLSLHDLQGVGVTGIDAEARCDAAGITLNKNAIPFDPQKPGIASGIRVGTPCVTTQGMGEDEMRTIARLIATAVTEGDSDPDHPVSKEVRAEVTDLVGRFPAYPR